MACGGGSRSVLGSSDEVLDLKCGICINKGKHREAKTFCKDCEGYLCISCTDTHIRFPAQRNHKTISVEQIRKLCGICQTDGKSKDAVCFCKDCDYWICGDCKESHDNFRDLQNHTIISGKDVFYSNSTGPSEVSDLLRQLSTKPSEEESHPRGGSGVGSETKPQSNSRNEKSYSSTQPSDNVPSSSSTDSVTALSSQTKPSIASRSAQHDNIDILRYKTIKKTKKIRVKVSNNFPLSERDNETCYITSCCFMSKGELIACDNWNSKLKLLDRSLKYIFLDSLDLPGKTWPVYRGPWAVAAVDNSNVIVTIPWLKVFTFIQVLPSLKVGRTIYVGEECWGVAVAAGKIFVSCYNDDDKVGDIRVYDLEGRDLGKRLGINPDGSNMFNPDGSKMFSCPEYVAASRSGDKIFVSDRDTNTVSCLTGDGELVYQYRDRELERPTGLLVDDNDNVIVCCYASNSVQVITSAGEKHNTLLSKKEGILNPQCVSFRPSDGTLVVYCDLYDTSDKLHLYKMS